MTATPVLAISIMVGIIFGTVRFTLFTSLHCSQVSKWCSTHVELGIFRSLQPSQLPGDLADGPISTVGRQV